MQSIDTLKTDLIARINAYCGDDQAGRRSLRALAERSGVSRNTLSLLRNGNSKNPTYETLSRVHSALLEFEGNQ